MCSKKRRKKAKKNQQKVLNETLGNELHIECEICKKEVPEKDLRYVNGVVLCKNCLRSRKEICEYCKHTKLKGMICTCRK